ncbi:hypothetical protein TNCT_727591 [Trichonephila clavata]|uniref:Uncharacterized protein n=1 Tax=Trichonephila clavata TaxID=2740835 RepID=A0A8X6HRK8_TRICU|nr:hypothetical protein TNCT_727591 [Trichonephila clavata]
MAKGKCNLPASPTKSSGFCKKIAAEFQVTVFDKNDTPKTEPRKLSEEGKKQTHDFYNKNDISRQMTGIRDVKTVKYNMGV